LLSNFSVTFSIISVITGITTLYSTGLTFGGPISMLVGCIFGVQSFVAMNGVLSLLGLRAGP
nr:amino-acid permease BAT1 homolog isoform X1 [Tanacetum cinerariifolium]